MRNISVLLKCRFSSQLQLSATPETYCTSGNGQNRNGTRSARPYSFKFPPESTGLIIIDMQRDFLDPNGFGAIQCGNDEIFQAVREIVPKTRQALAAAREMGLHVIHAREGHKPDLSDLPPSKRLRQISAPTGHHTHGIGDEGPMGRLLVRGEYGHDIIDELRPLPGELVIDKPGKGSFWDTSLHRSLLARGITHLLVAGVTTECCVNTTFRELADRGFDCCALADCTSGFDSSFYTSTLDMLCSYDGLFGFVASSAELVSRAQVLTLTPPMTPPATEFDVSLTGLRSQYLSGRTTPIAVVQEISRRVESYVLKGPAVWTHREGTQALTEAAEDLEKRYRGKPVPPLYGIPFAVKDNIDVAGIRTTAACDAFPYTPRKSAGTVDAMLEAGALFVGKTNLDQLVTGLSGCRSPYGIPRSIYSTNHISGGSSSGSAVAVGAGLVSFALATDTAGSGRVPAMFNGVVGFTPTKGTFSAQGLVPACKSLDTITVIAQTVEEARSIWLIGDQGVDEMNPYAKHQQSLALWQQEFRGPKRGGFKFGVSPQSALDICTLSFQKLFRDAASRLERAGGSPMVMDWKPFKGGSDLLYGATLLQERIASIGLEFIAQNLESLEPAVREIFNAGLTTPAKPWEVFRDLHLQAEYTHQASMIFDEVDVLLVPTTTCHPTVEEMQADPVKLNAKLGEFGHFGNVLDLCGIALPAGTYPSDDGKELPFGVCLLGATGTDGRVIDIAREFENTK